MRRLPEVIDSGRIGYLDLSPYVTVEEECPVREVLRRMRQVPRSIALVLREGQLTGVFTERDVLRKIVARPDTWDRPICEFMTPDPCVAPPEATVRDALRLMNAGRFRDLPVVDRNGAVLGNLTHLAVVGYLCNYLQAEVLNLPPVPSQVPKTVEGA